MGLNKCRLQIGVSGIDAVENERGFWDGFDYQKALDNAVAQEGINNPNSKWLVANKRNANLVNETFGHNTAKVQGNKIYMSNDGYSKLGANFGTKGKGNLTLVSRQAIRNKGYFSLTDILRHEGTHQGQVLAGMTARSDGGLAMEIAAYMSNICHPATTSTIQKAFNILVNDWGISESILWETILNIYPYGPIP